VSSASPRRAERYRRIIERLPFGVMVHDEQGDILFANTPAAELVGVASGAALVGTQVTEVFAGPFLWGVRERLMALSDEQAWSTHVRRHLTRADGVTVEVEVAATPFLAGARGEVQLVFNDVGPEGRADRARAQTVTALEFLLERLPGVAWTTDESGVITWSHARDGATPGLLSGTEPLDGLPLDVALGRPDDPQVAEALAKALRGELTTCEIRLGARAAVLDMGPLRGPTDGPPIGTVGLAIDVTDRRLREDHRREQERLDGLARLSGGVAHEFNNVLGTILARAEVLRLESTRSEALEDLDAVIAATRRGSAVAAQLLGFARGGSYRREAIEVNALVSAAAARAEADAGGTLAVRVEPAPEALHVQGDPHHLAMALDALTLNAREAMSHLGSVTLRASGLEFTAADIEGSEMPPGSFVMIEVADNGHGMPSEVRERAFDPYFTTRGDGHGLGLSMAYGVARHHEGLLQLVSEVGLGTRARLILPLLVVDGEPAARPDAPARVAPSTADRGTALVVDDEALVRKALARLLNHRGYTVVEAEDGHSALAIFAQPRPQPFAFVLLDMRMPRMNGDEVLRRLIAMDPEVRIIICTGYDHDQVTQRQFELGNVVLLRKPFGVLELEAQIEAVTARG